MAQGAVRRGRGAGSRPVVGGVQMRRLATAVVFGFIFLWCEAALQDFNDSRMEVMQNAE